MAVYPQYQRDGLAGALAIHLCIYCAVGGCFAFGLYELLQPTRFVNPGIAAYKPSPATVIAYGPSSGLPPPPDVTVPAPVVTDDIASRPEPTVRSAFAHAPEGIESIERQQPAAKLRRRQSETTNRRAGHRRRNRKMGRRGWRVSPVTTVPARSRTAADSFRRIDTVARVFAHV